MNQGWPRAGIDELCEPPSQLPAGQVGGVGDLGEVLRLERLVPVALSCTRREHDERGESALPDDLDRGVEHRQKRTGKGLPKSVSTMTRITGA